MLFNSLVGGLAVLVLLIRPSLLGLIFNSSSLVPYAPYIGLLILFGIVSQFLEIGAIANQESRLSTIFIIAAQLTKVTLLLTAAMFFGSIRALLYGGIIQGLLQTITLLIYLRSRFGLFWSEFDWAVARTQLAYALPIGFAAILYIGLNDLHNYFVSYRFGPAAFALYAVGCFSLPLVGIIGESVGPVMIPRVSKLQKEGKTQEIIHVTAAAMRKLSAIYFPVYALLLVVGRELIALLFTKQYADSWPIFAINLTTLPFLVLIADPIIRAHTEYRYFLLKVRAVTIVVLFTCLWFGTQYFGLVGAISAMVLVNIGDRLIEAFKAWRIVGVRWQDIVLLRDVGKVGLAAVAAGFLAAVVRLFTLGGQPLLVLVLCSVAFGCAYLAFIWLFAVPTNEERAALRNKIMGVQWLIWWRRAVEPVA
jgi:O-antigen/teichoic acid export membrane protein